MARGDEAKQRDAKRSPVLYPPGLVPVLRALATERDISVPLSDAELEQVLVASFFASLRAEEHEHHPLRIAITRVDAARKEEPSPRSWDLVRFRSPVACTPRQLMRLARAVRSERLYVAVASDEGRLIIAGLARELTDPNESSTLKLVAPEAGNLEVWIGRQRVLEYAQGRIMDAPENLLVLAGHVRDRLRELSSRTALPDYVESVTALVRNMAEHPHGGILVVTDEAVTSSHADAGFLLERGMSIGDVLEELRNAAGVEEPTRTLRTQSAHAELERRLAEVGRLSALDGATLLDTRLTVLGFGVILPVIDDVVVRESVDAAASTCASFPIQQYGARHRAAASFASMRPGSLVFLASADGDMACMLRQADAPHVTMWRFRSGDLA